MASQSRPTPAALQLLPSSHGAPLQTWEFREHDAIHIGRASECDVVIMSPVVSRSHAYLRYERGEWQLLAISQNGVFVNGERVQGVTLSEGMVFRLAATGPYLRFSDLKEQRSSVMQTWVPDDSTTAPLLLDAAKRDRQVAEIADAPYFLHLQELAKQLRNPSSRR